MPAMASDRKTSKLSAEQPATSVGMLPEIGLATIVRETREVSRASSVEIVPDTSVVWIVKQVNEVRR